MGRHSSPGYLRVKIQFLQNLVSIQQSGKPQCRRQGSQPEHNQCPNSRLPTTPLSRETRWRRKVRRCLPGKSPFLLPGDRRRSWNPPPRTRPLRKKRCSPRHLQRAPQPCVGHWEGQELLQRWCPTLSQSPCCRRLCPALGLAKRWVG